MKRRSLRAAWLVAFFACATQSPSPSPIPQVALDGYRLFAKRDCAGVHGHRLAFESSEGSPREELLRLLDAYCLELAGDTAAAKDLYSSISAADPRTLSARVAAREAEFRLADSESLEHGVTREQREQRMREAKSSQHQPGPRALTNPTPDYPFAPHDARIEGAVTLGYEIQNDGTVSDVIVLESDPPFIFDRNAIAAVERWTFEASANRAPIQRVLRWNFELGPGR